MMGEKGGGKPVRRGEEPILRSNARESFEGFLGELRLAIVVRECVQADQCDGRD